MCVYIQYIYMSTQAQVHLTSILFSWSWYTMSCFNVETKSCSHGSDSNDESRKASLETDGYFDLGLSSAVTTPSNLGILDFTAHAGSSNSGNAVDAIMFWLKHGWVHYWAFHHEEAIICFKKAIDIDNECVMAYWGISMANGPNYNAKEMNLNEFPSATDAYNYAQRAIQLAANPVLRPSLSQVELALVEAIGVRYNKVVVEAGMKLTSDNIELDMVGQNTVAFAEALRGVYVKFGAQVPCVACLYAEALCNSSPWDLWDLDTGKPKNYALEVLSIVEKGLLLAPAHPGLNHFMIHVLEMSPHPERALTSCSMLKTSSPEAPHLLQ